MGLPIYIFDTFGGLHEIYNQSQLVNEKFYALRPTEEYYDRIASANLCSSAMARAYAHVRLLRSCYDNSTLFVRKGDPLSAPLKFFPKSLLQYTVDFLSLEDAASLKQTCLRLKQISLKTVHFGFDINMYRPINTQKIFFHRLGLAAVHALTFDSVRLNSYNEQCTEEALFLLRLLPLKKLEISLPSYHDNEELISRISTLKELILHESIPCPHYSPKNVLIKISKLPLHSLEIRNGIVRDCDLVHIGETPLKSLKFIECAHLTHGCIKRLKRLTSLKYLEIRSAAFSQGDAEWIKKEIPSLEHFCSDPSTAPIEDVAANPAPVAAQGVAAVGNIAPAPQAPVANPIAAAPQGPVANPTVDQTTLCGICIKILRFFAAIIRMICCIPSPE